MQMPPPNHAWQFVLHSCNAVEAALWVNCPSLLVGIAAPPGNEPTSVDHIVPCDSGTRVRHANWWPEIMWSIILKELTETWCFDWLWPREGVVVDGSMNAFGSNRSIGSKRVKTGTTEKTTHFFDFATYGNWGGFGKTEVCGKMVRNFMGPGAAGSGRTEWIVKSQIVKFFWILGT